MGDSGTPPLVPYFTDWIEGEDEGVRVSPFAGPGAPSVKRLILLVMCAAADAVAVVA